MQRILIVLVVGLLSVGCLTPEQKQKRLRDSVVGEYEYKYKVDTNKLVFLENGVRVHYRNGKKRDEAKWSIVDGEIHVEFVPATFEVWRINPDKSFTSIAHIEDGKRTDWSKENQFTFKKIK